MHLKLNSIKLRLFMASVVLPGKMRRLAGVGEGFGHPTVLTGWGLVQTI